MMAVLPWPPGPTNAMTLGSSPWKARSSRANSSARPKNRYGSDVQWWTHRHRRDTSLVIFNPGTNCVREVGGQLAEIAGKHVNGKASSVETRAASWIKETRYSPHRRLGIRWRRFGLRATPH